MGFRDSVSLLPAILATEPLALAPVGLPPTERADLRWTHSADQQRTFVLPRSGQAGRSCASSELRAHPTDTRWPVSVDK